ncbi:MAG TPA: flagellar protein FlgN [Fontimonas sp.]
MNEFTASTTLQENLHRHCASLQLLVDLLQEENQALQSQDVADLERITQAKAQAADHLNLLGRELPPAASVARAEPALWTRLQTLAAQCQLANKTNAMLLDTRTRAVRGRLELLRSGYDNTPQGAAVYGRTGISQSLGSRRFGFA